MGYLVRHIGRISFLLFLISLASGVLLAVYYRPFLPYASISYIERAVDFGAFVRSVHHRSADLLIFAMGIHMLRGVVWGKYKLAPKCWLSGCLLGTVVIGCAFKGDLLVWDQPSYWATVIGLNVFEAIPLIGKTLRTLLVGGTEINRATIARIYSVHAMILPGAIFVLMMLHLKGLDDLWQSLLACLRHAGILGRKRVHSKGMDDTVLPNISLELMEILGTIGGVLVFASLFPLELAEEATPPHYPFWR